MRWTDGPIHFIDFEGSIMSGILEYGVATVRGGEVTGVRSRLCRAIGRIRPEDLLIHGLRAEELREHAPFTDDFEYFTSLRATGPLAAHYAQAENSLLKSAWPYPRTSPDFSGRGGTLTDWGPWIDTGRLYAEIFPTLETGRLQPLIERFGLQAELDALALKFCSPLRRRYHAALYDALAAALLLVSLGRRAEFAAMSIPWLLQQSTANPEKRAALRQDELF